jgi:opacity protein-like surface antigen
MLINVYISITVITFIGLFMKKILVTAAAIALMAASANAKSAGDSFYVKGSLGYGFGQKTKVKTSATNVTSKSGKGLLGNIGAGMSLANGFRSDAELYLDDGMGAKAKGYTSKFKAKTTGVFLNGYLDIKNSSPFTPYVMAGLGWAHTKFAGDQQLFTGKKKSKNSLAYQAGLGVSYAVSKNVALDVGYRYIDKRATLKSGGKKLTTKGMHTGLVGVRISF